MQLLKNIIFIFLFLTTTIFAHPPEKIYKVVVIEEWQPYYNLDNNGKPKGYAIDLFKIVASNINLKYEFIIVDSWKNAFTLLKNNKVDIVPNVGKTSKRAEYLLYSQTTDLFEIKLFKNKKQQLDDLSDLKNLKVGVLKSNVCEKIINSKITDHKVIFTKLPEAITALNNNEINALCSPSDLIKNSHNSLETDQIEKFHEPLKVIHRGFGLTHEHSELLTLIDNELIRLKANGEYQKIYNKWFVEQKDFEFNYEDLLKVIVIILIILLIIMYIIKSNNLLITKKELEKKTSKIQRDQKLFYSYINNMNSLFVVLDTQGNIKMINTYGSELLGFTQNDLLGKNWFEIDVLPKHELKLVKNYFKQVMQRKADLPHDVFENQLIDKNGERLIFKWSNSLLYDNGKITGVVSSGVDITNEKKQKDIIDQQTKLASMGEMIGNIAHQWRQPLSVISTAASGVKLKKELDTLDDVELFSYMDNIVFQASYLSNTIDIFRDFIKEDKKINNYILQDVINEALEIVKPSLDNNHIKLINETKDLEDINIELVAGELSQVMINIINNSKDAIKDHEIQNAWIKIDITQESNLIYLSIEDNGGGIPSKVMPNIFDPYFTTKHSSLGTGLGLHMCYKIVTDSLNGKIYAENTNNGAKFTLIIPTSNQ